MPLDLNDAPEQRSASDAQTQRDWERERAELIASLQLTASQWVPEVFPQGKIDRVKKELRCADISGRAPRKDGSCVIQLAGKFAGSFKDFGTGESGGPISTIARHFGVSGRDAIDAATEVAERYGYQANRRTVSRGGANAKRSTMHTAEAAAEAANHERDERSERNIAEAAFELGRSVPAAGTLVETYFASRGLTLPATDDLRFGGNVTHWETKTGKPTLIAVIRYPDGTPTGGIHRIYLTDDGSAHLDKKMLGPVDGGVVMLAPPASDGTLGVAEGIETASAAMQLTGVPCWSTLSAGGMKKLGDWLVANSGKLGIKRLIVFADGGDAGESAAAYLQAKATDAGIAAEVRLPRGGDDFADDLAKGLGAPAIDVPEEQEQPPAEPLIAPAFAAPIPAQVYDEILMVVLSRLADDTVGFDGRVAEWEAYKPAPWPMLDFNPPPPPPPKPAAPAYMISGPAGTGKTRQWIELIAVPAVAMGNMVIISVPRLELADEIAKIFADRGIDAAVYRGREAPDPNASPKARMCRESDRVKSIELALAPIDQKACKTKDHECQFYQTCGYQKQQKLNPQVWIITHPLLFYNRPDFIHEPLQFCIDEAFWSQSLKGLDKPYSASLKELRQHRPIYTGKGADKELDAGATADLRDLSDRIANAIEADGLGRIRRSALTEVGITADDAIAAFRLEWRRKEDLDVYPDMAIEQVHERSKLISDRNQQVARLARFFELLARTLGTECVRSPWLEMKLDDASERSIFMAWRMEIHHSWAPLGSVAILNAATRPAIVRPFFPSVAVPTMHSVAMPHTHVTQIVDKAMTLDYGLRNAKDIRRHIEIRAAETAGKVLVVCQEALESALRKAFIESAYPMPANVEIAHFNNVAGLNSWQDVELLIVIGRTEPSPRTVEGIARAYFGREVIEVEPNEYRRLWYPRGPVGIRMRDGSTTTVIANQHPDWRVETIRWLICEAELTQALGRGRGVRRTAANPLRIEILCSIPLAIEVDEVATWDDLQPSLVRVMWARGVVPLSYRDMAAVHDDLFVSQRAAETAMQREAAKLTEGRKGTQTLNSRECLLRVCVGFESIPYRRAGSRGPATELLYMPAKIPDPEAWLTERLGPVTVLS